MNYQLNNNKPDIRLYFLGSGKIGKSALDTLAGAEGIHVAGVGTQPDRPAGRGREPHPTPIAETAAKHGIPTDKPRTVNDDSFLDKLRMLLIDMIVVMAFGQILKPGILGLPPLGCLNVHASLLPRYRGAAPIQKAILSGDKISGISFMKMDEGLDTGPVYKKMKAAISHDETAASLENKLEQLAANTICDTIKEIASGKLSPEPQEKSKATKAPKLKKSDGLINWQEPADVIERKIRAFIPWPRAYFWITTGSKERRIQIATAIPETQRPADATPGQILQADKQDWVIACGKGKLHLKSVIPSGKGEMTASEFLRGTQLKVGSMVEGAHKWRKPLNHETAVN